MQTSISSPAITSVFGISKYLIKTSYYDLAAIDVRMPDMNGFELYSEIKSKDNKIKVLFLTALRYLHDYDDFKTDVSSKLHQRHFIQKPVNDDEFLDQVYCILY